METLIVDAIITGIGLGSIFSLIAVGYSLILGACGVFNFAQGSVVMAGALVAYGLGTVAHLPVLIVVGIVMMTGGISSLLTYSISVMPLARRSGVENLTFGTFLSTLGVGLAFNSVMDLTFGVNTYDVHDYVTVGPLKIGNIGIQPIYIVMFIAVVVLVLLLELILRFTTAGLIIRAVLNDMEGAALTGISITKVIRRVFVIGGVLAAIAGFLIAPITFAQTGIADQYAFYGFAAMAIGGFGSLSGSAIGGILVGLVSQVPVVWVSPSYSDVFIYVLLLVVLLVRPQGLFGSGGTVFGAAGLRNV